MKKLLVVLAVILSGSISAVAQLKEGHVNYQIDFSTDNPEMEMALTMMQGSTLEIFFNEDDTKTEMKMGAFMNITTITNSKSDEMVMLLSGMMGNKAVKTTLSEMEKIDVEKPEYEITLEDEQKEIQGYMCKKAVLTDDSGMEAVFWYTEEIHVNKTGQNYLNESVPGFPMEFDINQGDMKMHLLVTTFEKNLGKKSKALFDMTIPDTYEVMTMEQLGTMGM